MTESDDHDLILRIEGQVVRLSSELAALDRLLHQALTQRDTALEVVAKEALRIQAQQNEWRGALADGVRVAQSKLDPETFQIAHDTLTARVDKVESSLSGITGSSSARLGMIAAIAVLVSIVSVVIVIIDAVVAK